jgi:hypothetical protein
MSLFWIEKHFNFLQTKIKQQTKTTNGNPVRQFHQVGKLCFPTVDTDLFFFFKDVLPGSSTFKQCMKSKMCMNREKIRMSKALHSHGSLVLALLFHSGTVGGEVLLISSLTPPWLPWQLSVGPSESDCSPYGSPHAARWAHWLRRQTDRPMVMMKRKDISHRCVLSALHGP